MFKTLTSSSVLSQSVYFSVLFQAFVTIEGQCITTERLIFFYL